MAGNENRGKSKAGSGLDAEGRFLPEFTSQREPFRPGNAAAVTHGAKSSQVRLAAEPETRGLAVAIFDALPARTPGNEITVELLAVTLRRVQRAQRAIEVADDEGCGVDAYRDSTIPFEKLREDLARWIRLAARLAGELALTPSSYARLQRDLGIGLETFSRAEQAVSELQNEGRALRLAAEAES